MMIPGLPEMVESTIPEFPGQERDINNLSSGLYNSFLGFGQVLAPIYGSFVTDAVGFRKTADIAAMICFAFALAYFILAGGVEAFRETCKSKKVDAQDPWESLLNELEEEMNPNDLPTMTKSHSVNFQMVVPAAPSVNLMRI